MNRANDSSTTNLSRTNMPPRRSAASAQQQHSPPSPERMTIAMMLQPQNNHNPYGDEDSADKAHRRRLCSFLQQALDLVDATESDIDENTIEDEWE